MFAFAAGLHSGLVTIAIAARESGRPIIRLTELQSARWHQRQEWARDVGCDKWGHVRGVWFAQDSRGFERIPVIPVKPRRSSAEHGWCYEEPGVLLGAC